MSQNQPSKPEHEQTAPQAPSTAADPAATAVPDEQAPALPEDQDAVPALRRLIDVIHKMVHELRHDMGHAISLVALHVVALGILEKTPLLALLTLR
jgi:hypothetical protein